MPDRPLMLVKVSPFIIRRVVRVLNGKMLVNARMVHALVRQSLALLCPLKGLQIDVATAKHLNEPVSHLAF